MAKVLVVDHAAIARKVLADALTGGGHEVVGEAGDGAEALARFKELRPDVTTLAITMPEIDGLQALREIRAIDPEAKVVMCSALAVEDKVIEAIRLGASDFVAKPLHPQRVLDAVGRACESA